MPADDYKGFKVKELQDLLQSYGIPHNGKKEELIERLVKHDERTAHELALLTDEFSDLEEFDEQKIMLDVIDDTDLGKVGDDLPSVERIESKETTMTEVTVDTPSKPTSNFKFTPVTFDEKPSTETPVTSKETTEPPKIPVTTPETQTKSSGMLTDAERAMQRAKRFGIQVNDDAKKNIRAQRFGASTPTKPVPTPIGKATGKPIGIDPEVLKKRAERFGLSNQTTNITQISEEEEKKRKRAERFNLMSKKAKSEKE
ncbi:hypothetical protein BDB01DRAFT_842224 [Pilobolus umbonatus]|nr:hypothetical protein BDB01DRAFT_842224 [Pilobolus umbonatus]